MRTATLLLSLLACSPSCIAQQGQKEAPKAPFVLEAGEVQLPALVDRCAGYLGRNILMNATEMQGAGGPGALVVRLQQKIETDQAGCEEVMTSLLYRSGFAVIQLDDGGMFEVVSMYGPRGREVTTRAQHRTVEQVLARPNLKVPVTVTVALQHINATIATNALRPFFASTGGPGPSLTIGNVGNNSAMLISGFQDQVVQAIRLVRECDIPPPKLAPSTEELLGDLMNRVKALEDKLGGAAPKNAPK
ncbi:MAG: hypothetical protein JNK15_22030 [Planctomycetes bacterium]|nr:hypothetical protein [Planctomycetota bacterium]